MNNLFAWMKSNPVTVIALVVALISLGVIGWVFGQGRAFRNEVQERVEAQSRDIRGYISTNVQIPPERPDAESEQITGVTITEGAIEQLERLYGRIDEEYREVFEAAVAFNQANHDRLVPALFTDEAGPNVPYEARSAYRNAFERMMRRPSGNDEAPRLGAGTPPDPDQIQRYLTQVEEQLLTTYRPPGSGDTELSDREREDLEGELRDTHLDLLRSRAEQINIYAVSRINDSEFPFHVGEWSRSSDRPEPAQLWEGQLELWIQEDIARAVMLANRMNDPDAGANVLNSPVKRLLRVEVIPGYVGLHTLGGVAGGSDVSRANDGSYPIPSDPPGDEVREGELPVNFRAGPTGRISNPMYDVRHARLTVVVDDQQLPVLFNALGSVNFMTVLDCELTEVDEYEALREGYVYGAGNAVEAEMIIETIWLREWTQELMPDRTREYLGIDEVEDETEAAPDEFFY